MKKIFGDSTWLRWHRALNKFIPIILLTLSASQFVASAPQDISREIAFEYIRVLFESSGQVQIAGNCPTAEHIEGSRTMGNVGVLVNDVCMGYVGEIIQLTSGSIEVSVDLKGAEILTTTLSGTTYMSPKEISVLVSD